MLQQPIYSLFIRLIPETFLILYSICLLTNSKVDLKKLSIVSIIGGTVVYITRLMPIHFGVHTILSVMFDIFLAVKLIKIEIYKAIAGSLIAVVICFASDIILIFVYTKLFQFGSDIVLGQSALSFIASFPSLIIFYLIIRIIVHFKEKRVRYEQD